MNPKEVFSGVATQGDGAIHYSLKLNGLMMPACTNYFETIANIIGWDALHKMPAKDYAWGYDGGSAEWLALDMLCIYAGCDASWTHLRGNRPYHNKRYPLYDLPPFRDPPLPYSFIAKHYKAFASEVIANLPDNWTLTYEQIDEWVKKREEK